MKRIQACILLVATLLFCCSECRKEHTTLNITLYDRPLPVVQSYILGTWKLEYGKGGICGSCIQYYQGVFWKFSPRDSIKQTYDGTVLADTVISWIWDRGTYTNGDSTYVMSFYDRQNVPWHLVVDRILNDTLILHDNSSDAVFYHFTKSN